MEEGIEDFFTVNNDLVRHIYKLLENHKNENKQKNEWEKPYVWESVADNLKKLIQHYQHYQNNSDTRGLAEVQVGLSKYFDFFSTGWMTPQERSKLEKLVDKIIYLSVNILKSSSPSYKLCGNHEDGACIEGNLGPRFLTKISTPNWPNLPMREAVNFEVRPKNEELQKGTTLFRIVGFNNNDYGCWWIMKELPSTKTEWRDNYAVLTTWNTDTYYVEFKLDKNLKVWSGAAASQRVPKEKCILLGGSKQIWIDQKSLGRLNLSRKKTPPSF